MVLVVRLFVALVGGFFVAQGLSKVDDVVWFFVSGWFFVSHGFYEAHGVGLIV